MNIQFDLVNAGIQAIYGPNTQNIQKLTFHSNSATASSLFFAIQGENHDGHLYIEDAIKRGAVAVVGSDQSLLETLSESYPIISFVVVRNVRIAMAYFAKYFHNSPDEKLKTIGVTGTNGKTTVAAYVRSLLTLLNMPSGSIGTTGIYTSEHKIPYKKSTPTTPESVDLHHIFNDLYSAGDEAVAMEVTSIGLDQKRVEGIYFDVAIHTNLSVEHLEYHKTFENYKQCKLDLFRQAHTAVINVDDEGMGQELLDLFSGPTMTYSLLPNQDADLKAFNIRHGDAGTSFTLQVDRKEYDVYVPVFGEYNVANILSAIGTAMLLGFKIPQILHALTKLESPEGRFQIIEVPPNQKIILDYAHTPVALTRLLEEVRKLKHNRLVVMIAGIGIRDFEKMPKMARAIEGKADEIIVTVDHPGHHDPSIIVDKVMTGFENPHATHIHRTNTREEGVIKSLELGGEGDIILLTSGCINGAQIVKGKEIPHSDEDLIHSFSYMPS
ncbi:UDP-N-acetylmuramoyl-L-alanyl-D-glutamate--2,6-diaminopimelate ligase [Alkalihalobacillus sp. R86527]|uniref:UDP-N-acetylmuramoyl-L-alanyl-D-glutamate--2, 6-diaminopimelate ligase n=1 Tax=Alkalihalobacillus sp. R86527 TaxID=3093863 RepID=UPI00367285AA